MSNLYHNRVLKVGYDKDPANFPLVNLTTRVNPAFEA
jgi:hypothetical protein